MKQRLLPTLLALIFGLGAAHDVAAAPVVRGSGALMRGEDFCAHLMQSVSFVSQQAGESKSQAKLFADDFSRKFFTDLRARRLEPYVSLGRTSVEAKGTANDLWFPMSDLVLNAIGYQSDRVFLLESVDEFRFVPHMMPGTHLVLTASDAGELSTSRQQKVSSVVNALGGKIHVVWHGGRSERSQINQAKLLAALALSTGGVFVDLSDITSCRTR